MVTTRKRSKVTSRAATPSAEKGKQEREALRAYARMLNTLSVEALEPYLADDFVYESQKVLTSRRSKREFLDYIRPKLEMIRTSGATVFAEMGEVWAFFVHQPCVVLAQGGKDDLVGIVLATVDGNKLSRLDLCVVPTPQSATRSGEYPT
jgi:hypothetical protein